jgi:toxin-antitoxin system PIN domain toxin
VDTNLLVYAHRRDLPAHSSADVIVRRLAEGSRAWAIPWPCVHEFYSVVTNPKIFKNEKATRPELALTQIEAWLDSPTLRLLAETANHFALLKGLLRGESVRGGMVHDARVFALCEAHGVRELWTADRDFSTFAGRVRLHNPLGHA